LTFDIISSSRSIIKVKVCFDYVSLKIILGNRMKGKSASKSKILKTFLLVFSFFLTIVLTASITLAWFYDTDWASNQVQMAGSVGIEMRNNSGVVTSDAGNLHFVITNSEVPEGEEILAYPGQAIDCQASVFNNGGRSVTDWWNGAGSPKQGEDDVPTDTEIENSGAGSACYVRAHFLVYTNIGTGVQPSDPDALMNAQALYEFLVSVVKTQNTADPNYDWVYYRNPDARLTLDTVKYKDGTPVVEVDNNTDGTPDAQPDDGYFYLCLKGSKTLAPLTVGQTAVFIWKSKFIIPWQLTNFSADKHIFVGLAFQAVQTFIPIIENGKISTEADNHLASESCTYDSVAVQTVFNTCMFTSINTTIDGVNYGDTTKGYVKCNTPLNLNPSTGLLTS